MLEGKSSAKLEDPRMGRQTRHTRNGRCRASSSVSSWVSWVSCDVRLTGGRAPEVWLSDVGSPSRRRRSRRRRLASELFTKTPGTRNLEDGT